MRAPRETAVAGPRPSGRFTGFGLLLRFAARRDRVRALIWIGSIVGLTAASAASVVALYDTQAALDEYAELFQADPALKALGGPGYGLAEPTLGAVVINEIVVYSLVAVALMSVFLVVRHTRTEEENGCAELVRSASVGRLAPLGAACAWVGALNVLLSLGLVGALLSFGIEVTGTVAYASAVAGVGFVFVGVAAIAAQIAPSARAALAGAGSVVGISFVLRAVGDVAVGWLTWLSPLGWGQSIRAFDNERWWVLVISFMAAVLLVSVAVAIALQRDFGAGFITPRTPRLAATRGPSSPLGMAFRLQRTSLISWTIGLSALAFFYGVLADQADEMLESEAIADFFAETSVGTPTELFLATMVLSIALIASGFTVSTVLRLRSEELASRAESILAAPVSRARWLLSYTTVAAGGTALMMLFAGLAIGLGASAQLDAEATVLPVLFASLAMVPAQLVLAALAAVLVGWRPNVGPFAWAGLVVCFVIGLLAETLRLPAWSRNVSPFHHVPFLPAEDFEILPLLLLLVIASALTGLGVFAIERRNIG